MMYINKMAAAVKANGRILREFDSTVYVPFGQEYAIHLKNMNSRRAQVKVSIDGEDVLNGSALVINANQSMDLERYLSDLNRGNKFKFIERTNNIEKHRGIKAEDGLIRIEFAFEKFFPQTITTTQYNNDPFKYYMRGETASPLSSSNTGAACYAASISSNMSSMSTGNVTQCNTTVSDNGITVKGSISEQRFSTVCNFQTDPSEVIVLRLAGDTGQHLVTAPVTVKHKVECETCGRQNKTNAKFCSECGTALNAIYA